MTLEQIFKGNPKNLDHLILVEGKKVYDYKVVSHAEISLITEDLFEDELEQVTVGELLSYCNELLIPFTVLTFIQESNNKPINSYKWEENKLILSF